MIGLIILAGATVATVTGAIWAWGKGKGAQEKARKEGEGLEQFWSQMPIVLIISVIAIVIMVGVIVMRKSIKEVVTGEK